MTTFYYTIPTLIEKVNLDVLSKVRNRNNIIGIGNNSTIDWEVLVREYLSSIAHQIFDAYTSSLGRTLPELDTPQEPFEWSVTFDPGTGDISDCVVFRVIFPDKFDQSTIPSVQKAIEDSMVSYAVWQWLMDSNIQGWELYEENHNRKLSQLSGLINRRIGLTRTYKLY